VGDLARSLEQLLAAEPLADKQRCLIASLNLSLERLDGALLAVLPRLGVFQGGALELTLLRITQFAPDQWQELKMALLRTGLVQLEGSMFLRFHPTLAPVLWGQLTAAEQGELRLRHQQEYYALVTSLYNQDSKNPETVRVIARRELPNLLWAVNGALDDGAENAVDFVNSVNQFLNVFGLKRDRSFLTERLDRVVGTIGSKSWYLVRSGQGEQLYNDGQYQAAANLFAEILQNLDPEPSFDRVFILLNLSRCEESQGQLPKAAAYLRGALTLSEQLEPSNDVKQQRGTIYTDLGDVFRGLGEFDRAQQAYENSLAIKKEIDDLRGVAVVEEQLGMLAMLQDDLTTAIDRYRSALATAQQLQAPAMEAVAWHQLGRVYEEDKDYTAADRAYRESARINEQQGNMAGAASTYGQLAILNVRMQKLPEAEQWYRKALASFRAVGDKPGESRQLNNFASLLANQPNRLTKAYQLALAALEIKQTLDPATAEIWKTYILLARIATAQGETDAAKEYHQLARTTKAAFAGTQYELQQYAPLIELVVAAVGDAVAREQLEPVLVQMMENGWGQLVAAIRRVLAGEREVEALWDDLDLEDAMIIAAILRGV
jgi:tetratricopeptide (TPR) repeat protein